MPTGRERLQAALASAAEPLTVGRLAQLCDIHVNTARQHAERLVRDGRAVRTTRLTGRRGRPEVLYAAAPEALSGTQPMQESLARMLLAHIEASSSDVAADAERIGRHWGRSAAHEFTHGRAPDDAPDHAHARAALLDLLHRLGFRPASEPARPQVITLHACPIIELVAEHQELVCGVHLGIMRGFVERFRAPFAVRSLLPLVTPHECVTILGM